MIRELEVIQPILQTEELDARILTDFRDAMNRVRTAAWSAQQYLALKETDNGSDSILSLLAGERVRVVYRLCSAVCSDLNSTKVHFQTGQLLQLQEATRNLSEKLENYIETMQ